MLEVEQVFSSYGRVKVMSVIMKSDELNISEITRRAGISHSSVALHLEFLVKAGLLTEKRFNRIRIFRVNHSNPYATALERFLEDWWSLDPRASEIAFN
jgi:predicted transcriptional regulator